MLTWPSELLRIYQISLPFSFTDDREVVHSVAVKILSHKRIIAVSTKLDDLNLLCLASQNIESPCRTAPHS